MTKPSRPVVRWHGGKWRLAPWIISHLPPHRIYVEPYCGAASVLMRKPRSKVEVLNDNYERIVNAFRMIRERPRELEEALRHTPYSEVEYQRAKEISPDPLEDARRLIVVGYQSRGNSESCGGKHSGWRRSAHLQGTHPAKGWGCIWTHVEAWADRLRNVFLECRDALDVIRRWDMPDTVFYVDPPYMLSTRSPSIRGSAYGKREMSDKAHEALAEQLLHCAGMVVLSGYRSDLYNSLFRDWQRIERDSFTDSGTVRTECLWISPKAEQNNLLKQIHLLEQEDLVGT
jgi:DNA adenine methylase